MFPLFRKFYSPDDSETIAPKGNDVQDAINFMALDDDNDKKDDIIDLEKPKPEKKDKTDKEDDDEIIIDEDDDLKKIEDELNDEEKLPTEEQLELVTPVRRREILKKYPELFKDFPYLEKAYYREQQFTEILPTIEDAKTAVAKSETLDRFEADLVSGKTDTILSAIKEENPGSFHKIVDDYLPALGRVDQQAYLHVIGNVIKHAIVGMVQESNRTSNETLKSAAQILNQYTFGSSKFDPPTNLAKPETEGDKKPDELETRKQEFVRQQFETSRTDLNTRLNNSLKSTIEANIDPKDSMTDYVKRNAVREANEQLGTLLEQDGRFKVIIDRLWENAFKHNFSKDSTDKIRSAYLSKAKTLLPSVIKKARIDALKGMGKRVSESTDSSDDSPKAKSQPRDKSDTKKSGEVPKGMRSIDFLMQD